MSLVSFAARRIHSLSHQCSYASSSSPSSALPTAVQFYQNKQLELYASKPANRLSLRQLVFFGRSMNKERLIKSANYVRSELPIRLAHRLRDLQSLPYAVVTQESMAKVYELYWSAFEKFRRFPPIVDMDDNDAFCTFCKNLLKDHISVIPHLALGMSLSSPHLAPEYLDSFMRRMLVSRISRRVLVEHHIALTSGLSENSSQQPGKQNVGIIYTDLDLGKTLHKCIKILTEHPQRVINETECISVDDPLPEVRVDGQPHVQCAYIREHLEYIVYELLKNAMRAVTLQHQVSGKKGRSPLIRATIVAGPNDINMRLSDQGGGIVIPNVNSSADLFSFSHARNSSRLEVERLIALREMTSRQKGLTATLHEQLENETDGQRGEAEAQAIHPRLGIGLPMSNIYARYFGGSLEIVSLDGWGTDVYLRLPKLGTNLEGIEV